VAVEASCDHKPSKPSDLLSLCAHCGELVTYQGQQLREFELGVLVERGVLVGPEWKELRRQWEHHQKSAT